MKMDYPVFLREEVLKFSPHLQANGELHDPVFKVPVQYGTPYYALCNALLADKDTDLFRTRAENGLLLSLRHLLKAHDTEQLSGISPDDGGQACIRHWDFFWPAILKTWHLLRGGNADLSDAEAMIREINPQKTFTHKPPSNWAMVWLNGEILRIQAGLSDMTLAQFDEKLDVYFEGCLDAELGLYHEICYPNSYDAFVKLHLAEILASGYEGRWKISIEDFLRSGLRRSLGVHLSDGSLASAYRSTCQTWTISVQCQFFTLMLGPLRHLVAEDIHAPTADALGRSLAAFTLWRRPEGVFSPVQNLHPPDLRLGYEIYSLDGCYSVMALAQFGEALQCGAMEMAAQHNDSKSFRVLTHLEGAPTHRHLAHAGDYSLHFNSAPERHYDCHGIADVTLGVGRRFQWLSQTRHLSSGRQFPLGIAFRDSGPGHGPISTLTEIQPQFVRSEKLKDSPAGFRLRAMTNRMQDGHLQYEFRVCIDEEGIRVEESTPRALTEKSFLLPYLLDGGGDVATKVDITEREKVTEVLFQYGDEFIRIRIQPVLELIYHGQNGYENRQGRCGLLRFDSLGKIEGINYTMQRA